MGKNLVVRLHVYLMCFLLAFSPAYSHAFSGNPLNFTGIANFARTSTGAAADYFFKDYAGTTYSSKGHVVSNGALGLVAFKRILGLTALGLAAGFAVDEIVSQLTAKGWTVDKANQEIFKTTGGWCVRTSTSPHPPVASGSYLYCSDSPAAAVGYYLSFRNPKVKDSAFVPTPTGGYYNNYTQLNSPKLYGDVSSATTAAEVRVNIDSCDSGGCTPITAFGQIFLDKVPTGKILGTPDDVAEVLPKVSDAQIASLMASPDPIKEAHAPTAAAAAKAAPTSETPPKDPPKDSANKCPAGQSFDATSGKCKSATAAQCPIGQVYDSVKKKCMSPKPDDDDDEPEGEDWPEFCEWAAPVCDFIEWAKQDVDKFEAEKVDVEDTADDAQSITSQILTLGYVSGGVKSCPSDLDLSFQFMGQSIGFEISYAPLCEMLLTARPVVIAIAYFQAAKIVFLGRRD